MTYTWNIVGASGTAILVATIITILTSSISWGEAIEELGGTWKQLQTPILMICLVMSVANVMNYAGMITSIALAVAAVGAIFPLLSPIIGWIGVFVTGSVVPTQRPLRWSAVHHRTADWRQPTLLVASNTAGGVMGKIVSRSPSQLRCGSSEQRRRGIEDYLHVHRVQRYSAGPGLRLVLRSVAHDGLKADTGFGVTPQETPR